MQMEDEELLERLKAHPEIRERLEGTLCAVSGEEGELGDADTAELRLIGDGACWIAEQVEERFGQNGCYLLDFYPVCDDLNVAARRPKPSFRSGRFTDGWKRKRII